MSKAQKKRDAFVQERVPLPPCEGCQTCKDSQADTLYVFAGDKWLCKKCFGRTLGKSYPTPMALRAARARRRS